VVLLNIVVGTFDVLGYSFFALHTVIHPRAVTEFIYRYSNSDDVAHIFVSFRIDPQARSRAEDVARILATLDKEGMKGYDISDDEFAKTHGRYMVGGRAAVPHERLFRFGGYMIACPSIPVKIC
jgi:threonine dehydratase